MNETEVKPDKTNLIGDHLCRTCGNACTCCDPHECRSCSTCYVNGDVIEHWRVSSKDGTTIVDGRNCVVDSRKILSELKQLREREAKLRAAVASAKRFLEASHIQDNKGRMGMCGSADVDNAIFYLTEALSTTAEKGGEDD